MDLSGSGVWGCRVDHAVKAEFSAPPSPDANSLWYAPVCDTHSLFQTHAPKHSLSFRHTLPNTLSVRHTLSHTGGAPLYEQFYILDRMLSIYSLRCTSQGSGFRVQGVGFRVQGVGFRIQGRDCKVQGAGFGVQGSGFRV